MNFHFREFLLAANEWQKKVSPCSQIFHILPRMLSVSQFSVFFVCVNHCALWLTFELILRRWAFFRWKISHDIYWVLIKINWRFNPCWKCDKWASLIICLLISIEFCKGFQNSCGSDEAKFFLKVIWLFIINKCYISLLIFLKICKSAKSKIFIGKPRRKKK